MAIANISNSADAWPWCSRFVEQDIVSTGLLDDGLFDPLVGPLASAVRFGWRLRKLCGRFVCGRRVSQTAKHLKVTNYANLPDLASLCLGCPRCYKKYANLNGMRVAVVAFWIGISIGNHGLCLEG